MLTRRRILIASALLITAICSSSAGGQQNDTIVVRIRADESVRALISPFRQSSLAIEHDQSKEAQELVRRSPRTARYIPIIFSIVGAVAVTELLQVIRGILDQPYYGGAVIDMRTQPPNVTSNPGVPANTLLVIDADGKTTTFARDQVSLDVLNLVFKVR
jgi:hypothetical protein